MTDAHSQRRLGIVLIIAAAIAWSTAPFFTRLLNHDSWTILFWRGVFASGLITVFLAATEGRAGLRNLVAMERSGWIVASLATAAVRRYRQKSMVAAAAMSNLLGSLISLVFAKNVAGVTAHDIGVLAMFGSLQVAMGLTLFVLGSRHLPSGEASLIATLET